MFILAPSYVFPWPVNVLEPDQDNPGKLVEHTFTARFELISRDEAIATDRKRTEIVLKMAGVDDPDALFKIREELDAHDRVAMLRVLRGWEDDLCDENRKPIPFNDATVSAVLNHGRVHAAFNRAYQDAISEDKARLGN